MCLDAGWEGQGRACSTVAAWWARDVLVPYRELAAGAGCAQGWGALQGCGFTLLWLWEKLGCSSHSVAEAGRDLWVNLVQLQLKRDIKGAAQLWQAPCHHSWALRSKVEWLSLSLGAVTCRDVILWGPLIMNAGRLKSARPNNCFLILLWNRLEGSSCTRAGRSCSLLTDRLPRHENEHRATSDLQLQLYSPQHPCLEQWQWHSKAGQTKRGRDQLQGGAGRQHGSSPTFRWKGKPVVGRAREEQWRDGDGNSCWGWRRVGRKGCSCIASPSSSTKHKHELSLLWNAADGQIVRFSLARAKWYTVFYHPCLELSACFAYYEDILYKGTSCQKCALVIIRRKLCLKWHLKNNYYGPLLLVTRPQSWSG